MRITGAGRCYHRAHGLRRGCEEVVSELDGMAIFAFVASPAVALQEVDATYLLFVDLIFAFAFALSAIALAASAAAAAVAFVAATTAAAAASAAAVGAFASTFVSLFVCFLLLSLCSCANFGVVTVSARSTF